MRLLGWWLTGDIRRTLSAPASGTWAHALPARKNEAAVHCPDFIYQNRNRVERMWGRLKEWRAVATRYEKTATSFKGVLCLAATMDWIKS